ncbi:MAG: class I SAM-dependent methyltransferase [bacterium]
MVPKQLRPLTALLRAAYRHLLSYPYLRWRYGVRDTKHVAELHYWKRQESIAGGRLSNLWYEHRLLGLTEHGDAAALAGKVVADFGCGPCGSLCWAAAAKRRIGIDVLADVYRRAFDLAAHGYEYVACDERSIPLPTDSVDVLFTLNAMDHVHDFPAMSAELLRILRPGGSFYGSFNLDEEPTEAEPQTLSAEEVDEHIAAHLDDVVRLLSPRGPDGSPYRCCEQRRPAEPGDRPRILWLRGRARGIDEPDRRRAAPENDRCSRGDSVLHSRRDG